MSTVEIKSLDERMIRRRADEWANHLLATFAEIEEIVVFGSFARGNWSVGSDLDVLIILSGSDVPVFQRVPRYLPGAFPIGVDLFPITREEIAAREPSSLLEEARRSPWRYVRR